LKKTSILIESDAVCQQKHRLCLNFEGMMRKFQRDSGEKAHSKLNGEFCSKILYVYIVAIHNSIFAA
jgi:hypothetical protein